MNETARSHNGSRQRHGVLGSTGTSRRSAICTRHPRRLSHPRLSGVVEALRLVAIREGLGISSQNSDTLELISRVSDGNLNQLAAYARELAAMEWM